MPKIEVRSSQARGEGAGFLASLAFTALASVRDVYFGGVFQSTSPLGVAAVAFTLCSLLFLPIALARNPASFRVLRRRWRELLGINVTTGLRGSRSSLRCERSSLCSCRSSLPAWAR